jgi:UDP-glucose 4-epimerase
MNEQNDRKQSLGREKMKKKTLAITGISGYFGKVLTPLLDRDPNIGRVIGIDLRPPAKTSLSSKSEFHLLDIRDPKVEQVIEEADALVHLAFVLMRRPGDNELDDINIRGTQELIRSAARKGIKRIVITNSVVGYGFHPDNPIPLTEESPLRSNAKLYYSRAKGMNEAFLDEFCLEHPDILVTRLRPCTVVGPHADPDQMASMVNPTAVVVQGYDPPIQLLHEEDLAQALHLAISKDLPGIYNVTSDDPRSLRELARSAGGKIIPLPSFVVRAVMAILWKTGASVFAPEWIDLSRYSIVASNEKLKAAGWTPKYTTTQAFASVLEAFGSRKTEPAP